MGVVRQCQVPPALSPEKRPNTNCTGGWVGPGLVWMGAENLTSLRIDRQNHTDCSKSTDYAILCTSTSTNVKLKNTELEHK